MTRELPPPDVLRPHGRAIELLRLTLTPEEPGWLDGDRADEVSLLLQLVPPEDLLALVLSLLGITAFVICDQEGEAQAGELLARMIDQAKEQDHG